MNKRKKQKKYMRRKKEILKAQGINNTNITNSQQKGPSKTIKIEKKKNKKEVKSENYETKNDKLIKRDLYKTFALTALAFLIIFLVWKFGSNYLPL